MTRFDDFDSFKEDADHFALPVVASGGLYNIKDLVREHSARRALARPAELCQEIEASMIDSTEIISRALARETALARMKATLRNVGTIERSKAVSDEERLGAALLRALIDRMDVFMFDSEVTLVRLVVPNELLMQLEVWGSATVDMESGYDIERHEYLEMSA